MSQQKYPKAYEAYQQAVYRDGRNPTFWCSIGVLYYQINQYRDALDAYSRAIRLNPNISEVWYDLGTLVSLRPAVQCFCATEYSQCCSTNPAITKQMMHSTHISVLLTSTRPMYISRRDLLFFAVNPQPACPTKEVHQCHRTYTRKHINPPP